MNHLGLRRGPAPTARLAVDADFRTALRTALQFGRAEFVSCEAALGGHGVLAEPCDVVVAGRTRTPQLAIQIAWHPRGEDHAGFVGRLCGRAEDGPGQGAGRGRSKPSWSWRRRRNSGGGSRGTRRSGRVSTCWTRTRRSPASAKLEFLAGSAWDPTLRARHGRRTARTDCGRLWWPRSDIGSPWVDVEIHARGQGPGGGFTGPLTDVGNEALTGHKDYSGTPLPKKLGIKAGSRLALVGAPEGFERTLGDCPPASPSSPAPPAASTSWSCSRLARRRSPAVSAARPRAGLDGGLWVAWPKKASKVATDLTFDVVQRMGLEAGLVDNKSASIDDVFQAMRFVYRLKDRPA